MAHFLTKVIDLNDLRGGTYYEAYAGGAGAALRLLCDGVVSSVRINDADARVHAFWESVVNESERFIDKIRTVPLTISEWRKQYSICEHPNVYKQFEVGFAAFYMNRCNRSGVLSGAGPIGGYEQKGTWKLDVRFSREALSERVLNLGNAKERIQITALDAIDFLRTKLPRGRNRERVLVYLDPPYVDKGQRLYLNAYEHRDHANLALYVSKQLKLPWIMSYDDTKLVRELYRGKQMAHLPLRYTLHKKRLAKELIIAPYHLAFPGSAKVHGEDRILERTNQKEEVK